MAARRSLSCVIAVAASVASATAACWTTGVALKNPIFCVVAVPILVPVVVSVTRSRVEASRLPVAVVIYGGEHFHFLLPMDEEQLAPYSARLANLR